MFRFAQTFTKSFLKNDEGVTAIEYCVAAACLAGTIVFGISSIAPGISDRLGNSMNPNVVLSGDCKANGGSGNCGVGEGLGYGNGTENEGQGQGPGA